MCRNFDDAVKELKATLDAEAARFDAGLNAMFKSTARAPAPEPAPATKPPVSTGWSRTRRSSDGGGSFNGRLRTSRRAR